MTRRRRWLLILTLVTVGLGIAAAVGMTIYQGSVETYVVGLVA